MILHAYVDVYVLCACIVGHGYYVIIQQLNPGLLDHWWTLSPLYRYHQVTLAALSHYSSLSSIALSRSPRQHPVSERWWYQSFFIGKNCCVYVGPSENVAYEFVFASPAVPYMFCASYLDTWLDGRQVTVQQLFCKGCCFEDLFKSARSILD